MYNIFKQHSISHLNKIVNRSDNRYSVQYGHVWCQNDGDKISCRIVDVYCTSTKSLRGYSFTSVYLSVCLCVCLSVCEQNADRTATPILTQSLLNSCLLQSLAIS